MWILFAAGSSFFAGITAILAKCGIRKTDSDVAMAIRTVVVLLFAWLMVLVTGAWTADTYISGKTLLFLVLSGLATGASWLCYFRALQKGDINKVVPIDKSSTALTILLALIFLHEGITWVKGISIVMIGVGTMLMITKKKNADDQELSGKDGKHMSTDGGSVTKKQRGMRLLHGSWLLYAVPSVCFCQFDSDTRQGRNIGYQLKSGHGDQDNGGSCHGVAYGVRVWKAT